MMWPPRFGFGGLFLGAKISESLGGFRYICTYNTPLKINMAHKFPGGLVNDDHVPFFSWLVPAVNLNQGVSGFQME